MSGTVIDKATALKHSVSGSTINKIVCKATNHNLAGPKKKHVDYLLALTNNPHANMIIIADMLTERIHNSNWIVVFKALITSHTLITLGNEKYLQALATRTDPFDIESFSDKSSVQATEMTPYIHRYSRYLGAVCSSYRAIVIDFFRMARGDNGPFRTMEAGKLLKATGLIQNVLDKLVDFDTTSGELNNGVINTAFTIMYQDLTKIYAAYNDAMINVLEHFFEMKKVHCKEAVECYRKFLIRQESVQRFLSLAEEVGIDKKKHLNLRQVPEDLLPALEQHLEEMDAIRKAASTTKQPSPQIQAASAKLSELKSKSPTANNNSGTNSPAPTTSPFVSIPSGNEDILSAQRKRFEDLKRRASDKNLKVEDGATVKTEDPLPKTEEEDEFTAMATSRSTPQPPIKGNTSSSVMDELFGLDTQWGGSVGGASMGGGSTNPWAPSSTIPPTNTNPFSTGGAVGGVTDPWGGTGASGYQEIGIFSSLNPTSSSTGSSSNGLADILQPMSSGPFASQQTQPQTQKLTTDVDSSLALAANNLSLELGGGGMSPGMGVGVGVQKRSMLNWGNESSTSQQPTLTGGPGYQGQRQLQPTTLPPGGQMGGGGGGGGMMGQPTTATGMYGGYFPGQQPVMQQSQNPFGVQPMTGYQSGFPPQQIFPQQAPYQSNHQQPSLF